MFDRRHTRWLQRLVLLLLLTIWGDANATRLDAERLRQHVEYLAADRLEGRETGEAGVRLAEEYIHESFDSANLATLPGQDDYFAEFDLWKERFDADNSTLVVSRQQHEWIAAAAEDFRPFPFSGHNKVSGEIVFAGYGITAPEYDWDDYADLDVTGKVVLVLRYEPQKDDRDSVFDGTDNTPHAYFTTKAQNAKEHGAIGMLVVQGPLHGKDPGSFAFPNRLTLQADTGKTEYIPAMQVRRGWLQRALRGTPHDLRTLQEDLEAGRLPASLPPLELESVASLPASGSSATVVARNVIAYVQGADPLLRQELLVVGAHHDHVGLGDKGKDRIFNGADDNASGTAVLLELAQQWQQLDPPPARSVVFVTFSAEEKGLLGSRALVASDVLPLDRVRFMINLDMLGRNPEQRLRVYTDDRARGIHDIIRRANAATGLKLDFEPGALPGNSDHSSFYNEDIPVLFCFTGTHVDYHKPGDHADKLDYDRMAQIGDLTFAVLQELADAPGDQFPNPTHEIAWLGADLTVAGSPAGLQGVISAVQTGSQADAAGLQVGDVITDIGPETVLGSRHVGSRLQALPPEQRTKLVVSRQEQQLTMELSRARPGYLGIAYDALTLEDRSSNGLNEEEGVVVNQVLPDSPAAAAGMHAGDILLRLEDQPVQHRNLVGRLQGLGAQETIEMQVLRDGERLRLKVTLGEVPTTG